MAGAPAFIDQTGPNNPAGLSPREVTELMNGGSAAGMKWLYPYEGTVFPGGAVSPLVMWTGNPTPDAVYLHIKSQAFEYKGILKPTVEGSLFVPEQSAFASAINMGTFGLTQEPGKQLAIPQLAWDAASQHTLGRADSFLLEVTERVNGQIHGPVATHIQIARGSVPGSIYYNSCFSGTTADQSDPGVGSRGAGSRVLRIPSRGNAEPISNTVQCVGCHSVSAGGSRLVAQRAFAVADTVERVRSLGGGNFTYAVSIPLGSDGKPDAAASSQMNVMGSYGALYPDGSKYLAASGQIDAGFLAYASELQRPPGALLVDAITGAPVADTGIPSSAVMPMFSPDGTRLVFNDAAINDGRRLAVMTYDVRTHKAAAYKPLVESPANAAPRPGWPFFLPDSRAVVFVQTTSENFTSFQSSGLRTTSDLYIADVDTGKVVILARAMGFNTPEDAASNRTYLPFGDLDVHRNFYPTVSPVAAGGYFWVFFDSIRNFGSMGSMRTLWGAAIDIHPDGSYTTDPSHPPFYVPGQEFISSNHFRAFAALDRCKPDTAICASGVECCAGACNEGVCGPPTSCAKVQERCAAATDCCDPSNYCINGFCSLVELL